MKETPKNVTDDNEDSEIVPEKQQQVMDNLMQEKKLLILEVSQLKAQVSFLFFITSPKDSKHFSLAKKKYKHLFLF